MRRPTRDSALKGQFHDSTQSARIRHNLQDAMRNRSNRLAGAYASAQGNLNERKAGSRGRGGRRAGVSFLVASVHHTTNRPTTLRGSSYPPADCIVFRIVSISEMSHRTSSK